MKAAPRPLTEAAPVEPAAPDEVPEAEPDSVPDAPPAEVPEADMEEAELEAMLELLAATGSAMVPEYIAQAASVAVGHEESTQMAWRPEGWLGMTLVAGEHR